MIAADILAARKAFQVAGPMSAAVIGAWVGRQQRPVPDDLVGLWRLIGSGDIFETEEVYAPAGEDGYDIDVENGHHHAAGLTDEYLVFHHGLFITAVDPDGRLIQIDTNTLRPTGAFASVEAWYLDLRGEYGSAYGLPDAVA